MGSRKPPVNICSAGKSPDDYHGKITSNSDWSKTGDNSKNVSIIKPTGLLRHQHKFFLYQGTESDIYIRPLLEDSKTVFHLMCIRLQY